MKIDFNGVTAPTTTDRVQKVIEPGVQDLRIISVTDGTAKTGTAFVAVEFNKADNPVEYALTERFYTSPKARWRLMHFLEGVLNRSFSDTEIDTDELRPELIGKVNSYVVDGEEYLKPNPDGGKPYVNVRANIAYSNFINPPEGTQFNVKKLVQEDPYSTTAVTNIATSAEKEDDDLPF